MTALPSSDSFTLGECAALACLLEATAAKPGNVHRGADFEDVTYLDFATSAVLFGAALDRALAANLRLGATVLESIRATRRASRTNTNLGLVLLIVPLALVPRATPLAEGIRQVLGRLGPDDSRDVYAAIRLAQPGGLGRAPQDDIAGPPPSSLRDAMLLSADRDLIARQYVEDFQLVLDEVLAELARGQAAGWPLETTITRAFVELLARRPDSLIARKRGPQVAEQVRLRAAHILSRAAEDPTEFASGAADLDFWLRSDGHARNPGTTADLIGAGLFAALRDGIIRGPFHFYPPVE